MKNSKVFVSLLVAIAYIMGNCVIAQAGKEKIEEKAKERLAQIKVVSQYRTVTDEKLINRSMDDIIRIFKETKTDFIFQGWMSQRPVPETCSEFPKNMQKRCDLHGYSYEHLRNAVSKIKNEIPDIILCGGVQAEFLWTEEVSANSRKEQIDKAWEMALDPSKWGLNFTKRDSQGWWAKRCGKIGKNEEIPGEEELKSKILDRSVGVYHNFFPDITNPDFQEVFLKRILKQIDAGVDAIWIDALYGQAFLLKYFLKIVEDDTHPSIQESHKAALKIVDKIHEYGLKKGKYIYVISWVVHMDPFDKSLIVLNPTPNVDIAMTTLGAHEIKTGQMNKQKWDEIIEMHKKLGINHIFTRIDYGAAGMGPLAVFCQELNHKQRVEILKTADNFLSKAGIKFIYPIRGGDIVAGNKRGSGQKLAFGRYNCYDALAPEFQNYETIKELAQNRAKQNIQLLDRVFQDETK